MGQSGPLFCLFSSFSYYNFKIQIEKSVDGVLGIRTCSLRMVGAYDTTELIFKTYFVIEQNLFDQICARHQRRV